MEKISFIIRASQETNDHEVRILIDGYDIISKDFMGLDPDDLFFQDALVKSGELLFARCNCGVIGCGDDFLDVTCSEETVIWKRRPPLTVSYVFDRAEYDAAIHNLVSDFSWETTERTAERLIRGLDFSNLLKYGLKFQWGSGRTEANKISVCFDLNEDIKYQIIYNLLWDHKIPSEACQIVERALVDEPVLWTDVIYYPQSKPRTRPKIAGPGWREFSL